MRDRLPFVLAPLLLAGQCLDERSSPVHTDLTGRWPVSFQDLVTSTGAPCTLAGVTLVLQQQGGQEAGPNWLASFQGTYSSGTLTCGPGDPTFQRAGTLSGTLAGSNVAMTLSAGRLDGQTFRPSMSWTLVELRGNALWVADGGLGNLSGRWTAGPIETPTQVP